MKRKFNAFITKIDTFFLLGIIVCFSFLVFLVINTVQWKLIPDEILYVGISRGMWFNGLPLPFFREQLIPYSQILYPIIIAPITGNVSGLAGYHGVGIINSFLFVCASIPIYILSNNLFSNKNAARWVALTSLIIPCSIMVTQASPDALAYLYFWVCVLFICKSLIHQPAINLKKINWNTVILMGMLLGAFIVRAQFIVLYPAFILIVLFYGIRIKSIESISLKSALLIQVKKYKEIFISLACLIILMLVASSKILGIYNTALTDSFLKIDVFPLSLLNHFNAISISVVVLPFACSLIYFWMSLFKKSNEKDFIISLVSVVMIFIFLITITIFDIAFTNNKIFDHYLFYLTPFLLIGTVGFLNIRVKKKALFLVAITTLLVIPLFFFPEPLTINQAFSPGIYWLSVVQSFIHSMGGILSVKVLLCFFLVVVLMFFIIDFRKDGSSYKKILMSGITFGFVFITLVNIVPLLNSVDDVQKWNTDYNWVDKLTKNELVGISMSLPIENLEKSKMQEKEKFNPIYSNDSSYLRWAIEFWNKNARLYYSNDSIDSLPGVRKINIDLNTGRIEADKLPSWLVIGKANYKFYPFYIKEYLSKDSDLKLVKLTNDKRASWASYGMTSMGILNEDKSGVIVYPTKEGEKECFDASIKLGYNGEVNPKLFLLKRKYIVFNEKNIIKKVRKCTDKKQVIKLNKNDIKAPHGEIKKGTLRLISVSIKRSPTNH